MFDGNKVKQESIQAQNVSGRDQYNNTVNHNYYKQPVIYRENTVLKRLLEEHEREKKKDSVYKEFSDELNNFFKRRNDKKLRDLSEKLTDGDRASFIDIAIDAKERVTKKIHKFLLYKSAQDIYTYLLINIRTAFLHTVANRIKSREFKNFEIDEIINNEIIEPFYQAVQGSSLLIDLDELYGILYLLTGNCYIEWD